MRIYLDMCCFNRPFDDQTQARIHLETQAKILLQQKVKNSDCDLAWSSVLDFECKNNPFEEHCHAILQWRLLASRVIMIDDKIIACAKMHEEHLRRQNSVALSPKGPTWSRPDGQLRGARLLAAALIRRHRF